MQHSEFPPVVNSARTNALRMSLAEWVYRMRIAELAREAVNIAITAALFQVTSNASLAELSGHNPDSRTLDKHKKELVNGGWVLIPRIRGGRGNGVQVLPALASTPVEFTDVSQKNPRKFCLALAKQTPAAKAPLSVETPAIPAPLPPRAHPRIVTPSGLVNTLEVLDKNPLYPPKSEPRVTFENGRLVLFNGLKAEWLSLFDGDELNLELALKQAAGYVQPNSMKPLEAQVGAQLGRMVRDKRDKDARYDKAVKTNAKPSGSKRMSLDELSAAVDTTFAPKTPRITHER